MFDVIIPIYKVAPSLLNGCLESVNGQTFVNYQVYVVDGTPEDWDQYDEVIKLISKYPDCHYIRQTGKGVSQARNQAMACSSNPYIAFLDGDDFWYDGHLEEINMVIEKSSNTEVIWWSAMDMEMQMENPYEEPHKTQFVINYFDDFDEWHPRLHYHYFRINPIVTSSVCIRRTRYEEVGGFPEDIGIGEDMDLWRRLVGDFEYSQTYEGKQIEVITGFHRHTEVSTSGDGTQSGYFDGAKETLMSDHFEEYCKRHPIPLIEECPCFVSGDEWKKIVEGYRKII